MKKKEIIICVLSIVVLILSLTDVFASTVMPAPGNEAVPLNVISGNSSGTTLSPTMPSMPNNNSNNNNLADMIVVDVPKNNNTQTTPITKDKDEYDLKNNNNITNSNSNIPNTGIADTPIIAVGICIISAVIAYTQIRRYKY